MTDNDQTPPVGSLGEEAARLLDALKSWTDESRAAHEAGPGAGAFSGSAAFLAYLNDHIATGGQDCTFCPLCQFISLARAASPEVKRHLGAAAASVLEAAAALLANPAQEGRRAEPDVEHIDLSDEWEDD